MKQAQQEAEELLKKASEDNVRRMQEALAAAQEAADAELTVLEEKNQAEIDALLSRGRERLPGAAGYILDQIGAFYGDR